MIFLLSLFIFIFDQITKTIIVKFVNPGESFPIIRNIFHITLIFNRGVAFGIFAHNSYLFIIVSTFIALLIIVSFIRRLPSHSLHLYRIPLVIILGGTLGNLVDRLRFGFVIDFLDFRIWPVFNIADIAITTGTILLIWRIFKSSQFNRKVQRKGKG